MLYYTITMRLEMMAHCPRIPEEFFLNDTFSPGLLKEVNATGNFVSAKNDSRGSVMLVCDCKQPNDPGIFLPISTLNSNYHSYHAVYHTHCLQQL